MLFFKGQGKAVDDAAKDLQELSDPVVMLCLIDEPVEDVVDLPTDISPEPQKLAIDTMQDGLEEVPLSRILTVEQVQESKDELLVDILLGYVWLEIGRLKET